MTSFTLPPWSFTMLETFATCPKKAFHKYLLKEKEPESEAQRKGNEADKALEARVLDGTPLEGEHAKWEPLVAPLVKMKEDDCQLYTQMKIGINRQFKVTKFFDADVWGRGVIDFAAVKRRSVGLPNTALIVDYKAGKNNEGQPWYDGGLQRKIFTLMLWKMIPGVDKITSFNMYINQPKPFGKALVFTREHEAALWREILPKIIAVEKAFHEQRWPLMPGPLCGYCPVKSCQFNRS